MKEWCMKHPLLTFVLVDEFIALIGKIVLERNVDSTSAIALEKAGEVVDDVKSKIKDRDKRPIGFVAS